MVIGAEESDLEISMVVKVHMTIFVYSLNIVSRILRLEEEHYLEINILVYYGFKITQWNCFTSLNTDYKFQICVFINKHTNNLIIPPLYKKRRDIVMQSVRTYVRTYVRSVEAKLRDYKR